MAPDTELGFRRPDGVLAQLLPDRTVGSRPNIKPNIKKYGQRFAYLSGVKKDEEFFVYAAQFGMGLLVWRIATRQEVVVGEPLRSMAWKVRGFGDLLGLPAGGIAI